MNERLNERLIVWIWLQECLGYGRTGIQKIFSVFEKPEDILTASEATLRETNLFNEHTLLKILYKDLRYAKKVYDDCQRLGYDIISVLDERYPENLRKLDDLPLLLYVEGTLPKTGGILCTAVVGSRKATDESKKIALDIGAGLAMNGAVVVSGGADGVDTQAHRGALSANAQTVCVLGCGLNYNSLVKDVQLRKDISRSGAVISEYPPHVTSQKHTFLQRDRIIAGMCECTVVVQAGIGSGSLATADLAMKYRRKVFVMKDTPDTPAFAGLKYLIRHGADTIQTHTDLLRWYRKTEDMPAVEEAVSDQAQQEKELHFEYRTRKRKSQPCTMEQTEKKFLSEQLTENAVMVYHTISEIPVDTDDISNAVDLDIPSVTAALTELEMMGFVVQIAGKRYIRK